MRVVSATTMSVSGLSGEYRAHPAPRPGRYLSNITVSLRGITRGIVPNPTPRSDLVSQSRNAADRVVGVLVCPILTRTFVMGDKGVDLAWFRLSGSRQQRPAERGQPPLTSGPGTAPPTETSYGGGGAETRLRAFHGRCRHASPLGPRTVIDADVG